MKQSLSQPQLSLTGGYLPKDQRVRVAREIRRTHFTLGDANYGYQTTQKATHGSPPPQSPTRLDYIANIRRSHIDMTQGVLANPLSEFKAKFPAHDLGQAAVSISQEARADLRRHHFTLGHNPSPLVSTAQGAYPPHALPSDNSAGSIQQRVNNLRKHNFQLGTDNLPLMSVTKKDYVPKTTEGWGSEERLKTFKGDLRTSHFRVGGTSQTYVSVSHKDFSGKGSAQRQPISLQPRTDNFSLGSDSLPLATTSHLAFTHAGEGRQQLSEDKLKDLRSSHFQLGGDAVNYVPTAKSDFLGLSSEPVKRVRDIGLRKSHFTLGDEGATWTTMYQRTHLGKTDSQAQAKRDRNADKASHLIVGTDPAPIVSVTQSTYVPLTGAEAGKLDYAVAKDLRSHHFAIGSGGTAYSTTAQDFKGEKAPPGMMDPELKRELRSHHFTYGHEPSVYMSRNQVDFQQRPGDPAKLSPALMKDLRSSHFDIGESQTLKGVTEYKGKYNWVQPVADKDYHFTFE